MANPQVNELPLSGRVRSGRAGAMALPSMTSLRTASPHHRESLRRSDLPAIRRPAYDRAKRAADVMLALMLAAVLSPVLLATALAVWIDGRGPVLFRQRRTGRHGKIFHILKFRTMVTLDDGAVVKQAEHGDKRVTRIGAFLRRTSLDELPQLFNVIRGDMSLVGPRPHALAHDELYGRLIANYRLRQEVRPGITGLAQVRSQRGPTPTVDVMAARVASDIQYVQSRSLWLDLKILFRTVLVLRGL